MSFKPDTGNTRKRRVVSDSSGLPSLVSPQNFTRKSRIQGTNNAERFEELLEQRRDAARKMIMTPLRQHTSLEAVTSPRYSPISVSSSSSTGSTQSKRILKRLIKERKKSAAIAARMARDNEIVMKSDEWNRAKERFQEAFNERRRAAARERASSSSSSSAPASNKKLKKGYKYEEIPVETPEIESSRSIRSRDRKKRIEDKEIGEAIKSVEKEEAADSLLELFRGDRGGKRKTRRVKKSKKVNKRSNKKKYIKTHRKSRK